MRWVLFLAFLILGPSVQAQDSLFQKSTYQAQEYIGNIQANKQAALHLWALNELTKDQPEIRSYIGNYISWNSSSSLTAAVFRDSTLSYLERLRQLAFIRESPALLIAYLISEKDPSKKQRFAADYAREIGYSASLGVPYRRLVNTLLVKKPITTAILPANQFFPVHFFLLHDNALIRNNIITSRYIQTAADSWNQAGLIRTNNLSQSLYRLSIFRIYYLLDEYTKIEPLYRPILNDPNFPISPQKLNVLRRLDYSMYRLGYYNRSIHITREFSLPLAKYLNQNELALKLKIDLGASLYTIGRIEESKQVYLEVQEVVEGKSFPISLGRIYNNLAINYWKSGEFNKYLTLEFKALDQAQKENNYEVQQKILRNLFTHYRVNKDFTSAQHYLDKAKQLAQEKKDNENIARLSYLEGLLYRDTKSNYSLAIASFDSALKLISYENFYTSYQTILREKALLLEKTSDFRKAKKIYQTVLKKAQERNDPRNGLYAAFSKANIHLELDQKDSAQVMLDTLNTKNLDALDFYQLVKARTVQARYYRQAGHLDKSTNLLKPVIEQIVHRSRSSGDLETGFWQVEPEYLNAFESYANLLIEQDQPEQAVEVLDQLKTINDAALYQNPLVRSKVLSEKELSLYKRLTENLDALRKKLLTAAVEERSDIQLQIDEKSAQKNALDREITANANPPPTSVNYVQRRLSARERVIHITELNDTYYLAEISRTDVDFTKIPISKNMQRHLEQTIREIAAGNTDLKKLYAVTKFLKIDALPAHIDELTIIPDSYLYQLPLDILPLSVPAHGKSYGNVTYLIERFQTNYMTTLNDFKTSKPSEEYHYSYAGFGVSEFGEDREELVPLPQAEAEIKKISNQLTALDDKESFINNEATEEAFREAAPNARIIHLATHSEVSGQDPMFSSIYFSREPGKHEKKFPGRIFAYEFFELNLKNDLVMLNSCESGSGSYLQGTGVVGMSRALRYAGAQALILNLWSVNDMLASEFAVQFYEGINNGYSKSESLRKAKLYFLKNKNANPHFWGSYMLLGNESPIVFPHKTTKNIATASFIIFFFSMVIASSFVEFLKRRKRAVNNV